MMLFVCHPKILHKDYLQFLLGVKMAPRETENNGYAKIWGDKERASWYVMVFSVMVNLVNSSWLWWIMRVLLANQKGRNVLKE